MAVPAAGIRSFLTPPVIVITAAVIAATVSAGAVFYIRQKSPDTFATVAYGPITQVVTVGGTVKPAESVDLAFQRGGTLISLPVKVGDHVAAGEVLAELQNADLAAQAQQAQANLSVAQANLAGLQAGARPQEIATDRIAVAQDLENAYIAADDAVHNRVDQFIMNPRSLTPTLTFSTLNSQTATTLLNERVAAEATIADLQRVASQDSSPTGNTNLTDAAGQAQQDLLSIETLLNTATQALAGAIPTTQIPQATVAGYQTSVAGGRTEISAALAALNADSGKLQVAQAGATSQEIDAQQAAVAAAQAALDVANATLAQSVIRAPLSGIITRQDGNPGEVVAAGQSFLSMQSDSRFQIDAYVSEADIAKISVGEPVAVSLDAYPGDIFKAIVIALNPAATVQDGVPSYKITAQFDDADPRIRAGLTANLSITTGEATSTLLVPSSAIITKDTQTYVLTASQDGTQALVPVTVGITGADGQTQVLSGLSAGEKILSFGGAPAQ